MASIFKRDKKKGNAYWIQYTDHEGQRKTAKGFTDKSLTEQLAAKLETDSRLRKTGLVDTEQEKMSAARNAPIEEHLKAFEASRPGHIRRQTIGVTNRIRRVFAGCNITRLADLDAEKVQVFLQSLQATQKIANSTYNHYRDALMSFCNWCADHDRLLRNPLKSLSSLNEQIDVKHPRRALTPEEMSRLIAAARQSGVRVLKLSPEYRSRLYTVGYLTGLRKNEIASLKPSSFQLDANPPTLTVEAGVSKHRRKDVIPVHPELLAVLPGWLQPLKHDEFLFPKLAKKCTAVMMRQDLKRAGISYRTTEGFADFHATRHTYITQLLRFGTSLPVAKELARHSNVNQTMQYTHVGIEDRAKALVNLPAPQALYNQLAVNLGESAALHMRCIPGGVSRQSESTVGTIDATGSVVNSLLHKRFGRNCHRMSPLVTSALMAFQASH